MPRKPRFYVADIPCHIVQRGNNKHACFYSPEDYGLYINILNEALLKYSVQLHAFVLMTNHVHLLMTPSNHEGISLVMQYLGRKYVRTINSIYHRTGTLWEGRHKASLIDSDHYLLSCMRYIELNPVRANMVLHPQDYHWSSFQHNAMGVSIACITPHPVYLSLGHTTAARCEHYRQLFGATLETDNISGIRHCLNHNYPLGNSRFKAEIEQALRTKIGRIQPGRPRTRA